MQKNNPTTQMPTPGIEAAPLETVPLTVATLHTVPNPDQMQGASQQAHTYAVGQGLVGGLIHDHDQTVHAFTTVHDGLGLFGLDSTLSW